MATETKPQINQDIVILPNQDLANHYLEGKVRIAFLCDEKSNSYSAVRTWATLFGTEVLNQIQTDTNKLSPNRLTSKIMTLSHPNDAPHIIFTTSSTSEYLLKLKQLGHVVISIDDNVYSTADNVSRIHPNVFHVNLDKLNSDENTKMELKKVIDASATLAVGLQGREQLLQILNFVQPMHISQRRNPHKEDTLPKHLGGVRTDQHERTKYPITEEFSIEETRTQTVTNDEEDQKKNRILRLINYLIKK